MEKEMWKQVPNYPNYMVSNMGRVKNVGRHYKSEKWKEGRILKASNDNQGYPRVGLSKEGVTKSYSVHRLVMLAFVGKPQEGYEVNHIDENRANSRLENLEYVTHKQNCNHGTHNLKLSKSLTGKRKSESHRRNISEGRKGMVFSTKHKENISKARRTNRVRRVLCIDTGEVFETVVDAQKALGLKSDTGIRHVCYGRRKTAGGYKWRFE